MPRWKWISLEQSSTLMADGGSGWKWWTLKAPNGQSVQDRIGPLPIAHRSSNAPSDALSQRPHPLTEIPGDCPVNWDLGGVFYLGEDFYSYRTGFCVTCTRENGHVRVGDHVHGKLHGWGTTAWLPDSRVWREDYLTNSAIPTNRPYIYIGKFRNGKPHDERAKVILKDGTTKIGPWRDGIPIGNWWGCHTTQPATSQSEMRRLLFEEATPVVSPATSRPSGPAVIDLAEMHEREEAIDAVAAFISREESHSPARTGGTTTSATRRGHTQEDQGRRVRQRMLGIAEWLATDSAIGRGVTASDMEEYATKFEEFGFHTVELLQAECTAEDLESFTWLPPLYKRILKRKLGL